jgi:S1-C subfamily serine protease
MRKWFIGGASAMAALAIAGTALFAGIGGAFAADDSMRSTERPSFGQTAREGFGPRAMTILSRNGEGRGGQIGLRLSQLNADLASELGLSRTEGVVVREVAPDSVAATAGFQARDAILTIDGAAIADLPDVREAVSQAAVGSNLQVNVARGSQTLTLTVTVPERSSEGGCADHEDGASNTASRADGTSTTRFARFGR